MKLKTATLIAIIGQSVYFLVVLLWNFVQPDMGYTLAKIVRISLHVIQIGTLIFFLIVLYTKQKK